eukprot:Selendium_serpulae@DN6023_c0_g1_i2.p1
MFVGSLSLLLVAVAVASRKYTPGFIAVVDNVMRLDIKSDVPPAKDILSAVAFVLFKIIYVVYVFVGLRFLVLSTACDGMLKWTTAALVLAALGSTIWGVAYLLSERVRQLSWPEWMTFSITKPSWLKCPECCAGACDKVKSFVTTNPFKKSSEEAPLLSSQNAA